MKENLKFKSSSINKCLAPFVKEVQNTRDKLHPPLPKTLVIREAKSSGWGGTLVGGCSVVSVCVYEAP